MRRSLTRHLAARTALLLLLSVLCCTQPALAEDDFLSIGPSKIFVSLLQGSEYEEVLRIENGADFPMHVSVTPWNFAYDEAGEIYSVPDRDAERFRGAAGWVAPIAPMVVPPQTEATVPVSVAVPEDARVGTHSAYLRVTGIPVLEDAGAESRARVRYQLNGLLLIIVQSPSDAETLRAGARLVSFDGPGRLATEDSIPFTARIENTGNVHLDLEGEIIVEDSRGRTISSIPVRDLTLLPEATMTLSRSWTDMPLLGRFTARMVGVCSITDNMQEFESERIRFWYVSMVVWYAAAVLLGMALGLLMMRRRRVKARKASEARNPG